MHLANHAPDRHFAKLTLGLNEFDPILYVGVTSYPCPDLSSPGLGNLC